MIHIFYAVGAWLLATGVSRLLVGAGLSIVYFVVLSTIADDMIDLLLAQVGTLAPAPYNLLGLAGMWEGLGYILSAILARITIQALAPRLQLAS